MSYYGNPYDEERKKKNQQTQFNQGYTTNTSGAEGKSKSNSEPKNKIGKLIRPKTQAERDKIPTRKTPPKPKMSRNEQNLRRRQGR
jgi:hypothetical protein